MTTEMTVEQARAKLGDLVIAAMRGESTVITRYGKPAARIIPIEETAVTTEIASIIPGRSIHAYDLLDEVTEQHGMSRSGAHEAIHALLDQIIDIDGEDAVILDRRPARPELLEDNPHDLDVYYWLTISEKTAQTIREAIAASHST